MSSRDNILGRLRAARQPFVEHVRFAERQHMAPVEDLSPAGLQARFVHEAETLGCTVTCLVDPDEAIAHLLALIAPDRAIQSWDFAFIPLPGLGKALAAADVRVTPGDARVRVGLTGAEAALAGTGSLVMVSGQGKPREASLLPPVHIAVVTAGQIVPNLDTWITSQSLENFSRFRAASNTVVISGPSRTGDIANILVKGVHGPGEVHVIVVSQPG